MVDGKIEVLGKKQIMLPSDVFATLEQSSPNQYSLVLKNAVKRDISEYAKKLGSSGEGVLKNIDDIFGTFGLGKLELVTVDFKKKTCILRLHDPWLKHTSEKSEFLITPAILSGVFSFLFSKDVDVRQTNPDKAYAYEEYVVG